MDIRFTGVPASPAHSFEVVLSKRNLDTLVGLYEMFEGGEGLPALHRRTKDGLLTVRVEPDEIHYDRPEGPPGTDPVIEAVLARGPEISD